MSQWTHVNASIRFDGILGVGLPTPKELGKPCLWEDEDRSHWNNPDLPCGSEGSIEYSITENPDPHSMAAMVVVFYGDLRNYSDTAEILEYFERIAKDKIIRSGILEIDVESGETLVYRYKLEARKWVNCEIPLE